MIRVGSGRHRLMTAAVILLIVIAAGIVTTESAETSVGVEITEHYGSGTEKRTQTAETKTSETKTSEGDADQETEKRIALTFDDGPHSIWTVKLLAGLRERNVRATFFLIGRHVERYPEIVRQIAGDGHLIGSHTYSHAQLTSLSLSDACAELGATNEAIFQACGQAVTYVRPPYGLWSDVLNCSFELTEVGWTIDPEDWKVLNADAVVSHVISHAEDEGIILLHDIYESSVEAALEIVDRLQAEGWEFVTADELILD